MGDVIGRWVAMLLMGLPGAGYTQNFGQSLYPVISKVEMFLNREV